MQSSSGYGITKMSHHRQHQQHSSIAEHHTRSPIFYVSGHQNQTHHLHFNNTRHLYHQQHRQGEGGEEEPGLHLFQNSRHHHQQNEHHHLFQHPVVDHEPEDSICNPFFSLNFKSELNHIRSGIDKGASFKEQDDEEEEDTSLHVLHRPPHSEYWHESQGDPSIKEPFCEPLNSQLLSRNNKRCSEVEEYSEPGANRNSKCIKSSEPELDLDNDNDNDRSNNLGTTNFRPFGELEAICSPAGIMGIGSGETSQTPEKALMRETDKKRKRSRKMMRDCELGSLSEFFESLVKQLLNHQEALHRKFLEAIEKIDQERIERESDWRRQEAAKLDEEAIARAHQQALATRRETVIISYLEKITSQKATLPTADNNDC